MKNNQEIDIVDHDFYEVPENVSFIEAAIFDWVAEHYGIGEAENGSWCIHALAKHIESVLPDGEKYKQINTVRYEL